MRILYRGEPRVVEGALLERLVGPRPPEDFPTNGMGPARLGGGWWGRALAWVACRLIPRAWRDLVAAPALHDYAYHVGGDEAARAAGDLAFGRNVVEESIARGDTSGWKVFGGGLLCWLGVATAGRGAFTYGGRQRALLGFRPLAGPWRVTRAARALVSAPAVFARLAGVDLWLRRALYRLAIPVLEAAVRYLQPGTRAAGSKSWIQATLDKLKADQAKLAAKLAASDAKWAAKHAAAAKAAAEAEEAAKRPPAVMPPSEPEKPRPPKPVTSRPRMMFRLVVDRGKFGPGATWDESYLPGVYDDGDNDERLYRAEVKAFGAGEVVRLHDPIATRAKVLEWMNRISDLAENGDDVGIGLASHGTNYWDARLQRMVPALCLDIKDRPGTEGFISGLVPLPLWADFLRSLSPECQRHLRADICHSGADEELLQAFAQRLGGARALASPPPRIDRPRFHAPPPELAAPADLPRALQTEVHPVAVAGMLTRYVAACGGRQTSSDTKIRGVACGAFHYFERLTVAAMPRASMLETTVAIGAALARAGYQQDPVPHADPDVMPRAGTYPLRLIA